MLGSKEQLSMSRRSPAAVPAGVRKSARPKFALAACDNCRTKRLKCTYNERPCMNCKLYQKECKQTRVSKSTSSIRSPTVHSSIETTQNTVSNAPNSAEDHSYSLNLGYETPRMQEYGGETDGQQGNCEPLRNDHHKRILQLDELFNNEILTSSIPFHDFSFLGDLMSNNSDSLNKHPIVGSMSPSDMGLRGKQTGTPFPKPSPISPYCHGADRVSSVDSLRPDSGPETTEQHIPPGLFIGIEGAKSGFIGLNSTGGTLAVCIRDSMTKYPDLSSDLNFQWLVQAGKHIAKVEIGESIELSAGQLPPKSLAAMCIAAYFNNIHIYYPIIREPQFQADWEALYDQTQNSHRVSNYLLFCLVVTIGAASDRTNSASLSPLDQFSRDLFQKACALAYTPLTDHSLEALQVILLLVMFLRFNGQYSLASVLSGLTIRLCQTLGLHRRSPRDFGLGPDEIRYKSQLWWIAFRFETSLAMSEGRPTAVHELTYDVDILPPCQDHRVSPRMTSLVSAIHSWSARLTEHCNRFSAITSLCTTTNARLDALTSLDDALMQWRDEIPVAHRPERDVVADWEIYMLIAPLHLEYFNLLRAIHWAFLMSASTNIDTIDDRHRRSVRTSDMKCLSAARSFVQTLNSVADNGTGRNLFPIALSTDRYVTILAVLYRAICENPYRMAAKADFEYLRAVKLHFERDSFSGEGSATMSSTIGTMVQIAEHLIRGESTGVDTSVGNTV